MESERLAAHFQAKRRPKGGEASAAKKEEAVFRFDFSVSGADDSPATKTKTKKRKKKKKNKKKKNLEVDGQPSTNSEHSVPQPSESTKHSDSVKQPVDAKPPATAKQPTSTPSFLKLRKATGSESELARMQLRYGQGRRNLSAIAHRERRRQAVQQASAHSDAAADPPSAARASAPDATSFQFNFEA